MSDNRNIISRVNIYEVVNNKTEDYDNRKYEDIINLPHPVSVNHPQMDLLDRAAQFSPFAALTGHGNAIEETARLAAERLEESDS